MSDTQNIVTIDGPAGVGKSTVSKRIAAHLGFTYLDTGAMYRGVALYLKEKSIDLTDTQKLTEELARLELQLIPAASDNDDVGVLVNGRDVSQEIRSPEMAMVASQVSAIPVVRSVLTKLQKQYGIKGEIVAEGRDTGTVVFPKAAYKFFLDAAPQERARRRVKQLESKGQAADHSEILAMIIKRDRDDSERDVAPLKQAEDATLVDTTAISIEQVVDSVIGIIKSKNK